MRDVNKRRRKKKVVGCWGIYVIIIKKGGVGR